MLQLRSRSRGAARRTRRAGVSLIEVLVAVSLLSLSLLALARISPMLSEYGRRNAVVLNRAYVLQQQGDRLLAIPYDSLARVTTGATTLTLQGQRWKRTITMTDSASMKKIVLVVQPLSVASTLSVPDTLVLWRASTTTCALNTSIC